MPCLFFHFTQVSGRSWQHCNTEGKLTCSLSSTNKERRPNRCWPWDRVLTPTPPCLSLPFPIFSLTSLLSSSLDHCPYPSKSPPESSLIYDPEFGQLRMEIWQQLLVQESSSRLHDSIQSPTRQLWLMSSLAKKHTCLHLWWALAFFFFPKANTTWSHRKNAYFSF